MGDSDSLILKNFENFKTFPYQDFLPTRVILPQAMTQVMTHKFFQKKKYVKMCKNYVKNTKKYVKNAKKMQKKNAKNIYALYIIRGIIPYIIF